jgi:hypothetical protein
MDGDRMIAAQRQTCPTVSEQLNRQCRQRPESEPGSH